jgi:RNA polymerase sigma-70 factor (ECF subfamily)
MTARWTEPARAAVAEVRGAAPSGRPQRRAQPDRATRDALQQEMLEEVRALRAFAISLTRDGTQADDLVQETLMKAWSNLGSFTPGTNMRAWLFTILRNTFYSERRKARREVADEDGERAGDLAVKPSHDGRLNLRDFRRAFAQLSDEQREVLILVGALQHSYEDAAAMCGVRVGTIKSRLNRGRARLADLMGLDGRQATEATDPITSAVVAQNGRNAG